MEESSINNYDALNIIAKNSRHTALEGGRGIAKSERHPIISKNAIGSCGGHLLLITWMDRYLKEA